MTAEGMVLKIEIKDIRKKDYKKSNSICGERDAFHWYLDNQILLNAYGRYFWYLEINRAAQIFAAYADGEIVFFAADSGCKIKGIGTALLNALEEKEKGKLFYLYRDDACTYQFYEHRGFEREVTSVFWQKSPCKLCIGMV